MGTFYIETQQLAYVHIPRTGMAMKKIISHWLKPNFDVVDRTPWMIDHPNLKTVHEYYPNIPTLTVARNPWQRLWSFYRKIRHEGYWLDWNRQTVMDLKPFNEWIIDYVNPDVCFEFPRWFDRFTCQVDFINYDGNWVDFILTAETLVTSFEPVREYLGCNVSLPDLTGYDHYEYRKHFNKNSRLLIEKTFERDIEFFGFNY